MHIITTNQTSFFFLRFTPHRVVKSVQDFTLLWLQIIGHNMGRTKLFIGPSEASAPSTGLIIFGEALAEWKGSELYILHELGNEKPKILGFLSFWSFLPVISAASS